MSTSINQKAYLQKYLSGPSGEKKKKKKKVAKGKGFKIIDDDVDLSKLRPLEGDELDIYGEGEDAPQIAGIIDERPEEVRKMEQFKTTSKWKIINHDDGFNSKLQIEEIKRDVKQVEKENELVFGKMYSDSEDEKKNDSEASPPRKQTKKPQNNSDSDFSPPRKNRKASPERSKRSKNDNDSDFSPPRKSRRDSPERPKRSNSNSDSDISPPRKNRKASPERTKRSKNHVSDRSPKRQAKKSQNSDSDVSPPRKNRKSSPERQKKSKNYDSDLSPPRKKDRREKSIDKNNRTDDFDASPSRRDHNKPKERRKPSRWGDFGPEENQPQSPDRKRKSKSPRSSDMSPPRRKKERNSEQGDYMRNSKHERNDRNKKDSMQRDRKRHQTPDSDLSPPRKRKSSPSKKSSDRRNESPKRMTKTLEGKMAGLQDARQLKMENDQHRRREDEAFTRMTDEVSGRNAQVVSRKGKRETSEDRQKQREKQERQKELDEKYKKWGRGLKQIEEQEARVQQFMHEASKPLARLRDDRDLESALKQEERVGDPMLEYMREKKRERGLLGPAKPMYKGNFPPNRFNIRPGHRWDGVDRSNGYENKYFTQQSKKKALEEEAYKWSTEDL